MRISTIFIDDDLKWISVLEDFLFLILYLRGYNSYLYQLKLVLDLFNEKSELVV